ncbi:lipopolysaccharide biosynthesis protein [Stenotrophomonas sp. WHRI 8082]|uniref:lipopolysaccharide biosynthesis protein n=1 Tax=Stenotrophomonas sp. WHRI 8082 TaxID=3162571 RepID=UPI0032EE0615
MSAFSNARWVALAQGSKILAQVAVVFVLARLMSPAEYGAVAMATIVTSFAMLFRDMGVSSAVIQRPDLTEVTKQAAFRIATFGGIAIAAFVCMAAPMASAYFRTPVLLPVLLLISVAFPLSGLTSVHQALLERDSLFRVVARIEVVSNISGVIAAITTALLGGGVFSLAALVVVTAALNSIQFFWAVTWRPKRVVSVALLEYRQVLSFSANVIGFNFVNYFARNSDSLIIGRLYSPAVLGAYSLAYRIMLFPLQSLTFVATRALFPVLTLRYREGQPLAGPYLDVVRAIALVVAPLMAGLFILRESIVPLVFGEGWGLVITLLAWFAPTGFLQSIMSVSGVVFMAVNQPRLLFRLGIFGAILQVAAFALAAPDGVERMAQYYLVANIVNFVPVIYLCTKVVGASIGQVVKIMLAASFCAFFMMLSVYFTPGLSKFMPSTPWIDVAAKIAVGVISYAAAAYVFVPTVRIVANARVMRMARR